MSKTISLDNLYNNIALTINQSNGYIGVNNTLPSERMHIKGNIALGVDPEPAFEGRTRIVAEDFDSADYGIILELRGQSNIIQGGRNTSYYNKRQGDIVISSGGSSTGSGTVWIETPSKQSGDSTNFNSGNIIIRTGSNPDRGGGRIYLDPGGRDSSSPARSGLVSIRGNVELLDVNNPAYAGTWVADNTRELTTGSNGYSATMFTFYDTYVTIQAMVDVTYIWGEMTMERDTNSSTIDYGPWVRVQTTMSYGSGYDYLLAISFLVPRNSRYRFKSQSGKRFKIWTRNLGDKSSWTTNFPV